LYRATAHVSLYVVIGHWDSGHGEPYWSHDAERSLGIREARKFQPTHWMPLPEYPEATEHEPAHSIEQLNRAGQSKFHRER
jgi:hypothetical protein